MSFGTPLAVVLTILFIVPGFLWKRAADLTLGYAPTRHQLHEYLLFSFINYLLGIPLILLLMWCMPEELDLTSRKGIIAVWPYVLLWVLPVVILPVLCGTISAKLAQAQKTEGMLSRLGIHMLHPAPTAWDYVFHRDQRYWARIDLADGSRVEGVFDSNSLASSTHEERDVFLETVFELDEESGDYEPLERNAGILVRGEHIKTVAFFDLEETV